MPETSNYFLASMSDGDRALLEPHLKRVRLEQGKVLAEPDGELRLAYFPLNAIVSLVVVLSTGETIEAAMVGRDGVVGGAAALDGKISLNRAIVQLGGDSLICDIGELRRSAMQSRTLLASLIRHEQTAYAQAQQSAACMAVHLIEARLCRWLLRARDLAGGNTLMFTQEFLAEMIGVKRTSVTLVAHSLQQAGIIKYSRGRIELVNIEAMHDAACECYDVVNSHYQKLLGNLNSQHQALPSRST